MPTKIVWRGTELIHQNIDRYEQSIYKAVRSVAEYYAPIVEATAKEDAPWTDRTGNARSGLQGLVDDISETVVALYLIHKMEYGVWLELVHQERYAVILPTMQAHYADIFNMLKSVLN